MILRHEKSRTANAARTSEQFKFTTAWIALSVLVVIGAMLVGLVQEGNDTLDRIQAQQQRVAELQVEVNILKGAIN